MPLAPAPAPLPTTIAVTAAARVSSMLEGLRQSGVQCQLVRMVNSK